MPPAAPSIAVPADRPILVRGEHRAARRPQVSERRRGIARERVGDLAEQTERRKERRGGREGEDEHRQTARAPGRTGQLCELRVELVRRCAPPASARAGKDGSGCGSSDTPLTA